MKYTIFYLEKCPFSMKALEILEEEKVDYTIFKFSDELDDSNGKLVKSPLNGKEYYFGKGKYDKKMFKDFFGKDSTFPRIYKGEDFLGGYTDLEKEFNYAP
tara:strand:+ start:115 stop:417 length:303 start_codon:yes stop_codon:yes gene_type:complete